jgi:hypothetical protein
MVWIIGIEQGGGWGWRCVGTKDHMLACQELGGEQKEYTKRKKERRGKGKEREKNEKGET